MNNQSEYGDPKDWSQIIEGLGQGAKSGMQSASIGYGSKKEAKEAKRRTISNLLNNALNRNQNLFRKRQDHNNEMTGLQSDALQQMARGFIEGF